MLMHPDESAHHEDGDDEGDEREIAEADTQEYSEAVHGTCFHGGSGGLRFGCLSLYRRKQDGLVESDEAEGSDEIR
jgi:hypothetical protein